MRIEKISKIKNAGVWKDFVSNDDTFFKRRTLIFGFNGSGKTTLSRLFSSMLSNPSEGTLPDGSSYEVVLYNSITKSDMVVNEKISSDELRKNILVYNTDFISKNFLWSDGNIDGIIYFNEKAIEAKRKFELAESYLSDARKKIRHAENSVASSERNLENFYNRVSQSIESIIPSDAYARRYDKEWVEKVYRTQKIRPDMILSSEYLRERQYLLFSQEYLEHITFPNDISQLVSNWISLSRDLISRTVNDIPDSEVEQDPGVRQWTIEGLDYHRRYDLYDCMFCGGHIDKQQKEYLRMKLNSPLYEFTASLKDSINTGSTYRRDLENMILRIPNSGQVMPSIRDKYLINREILVTYVGQLLEHVKRQIVHLNVKYENPSNRIIEEDGSNAFDINIWFSKYSTARKSALSYIWQHNMNLNDMSSVRKRACDEIENHILSVNKREWMQLDSEYNRFLEEYNKLCNDEKYHEKCEAAARKSLESLNVNAYEMNNLIQRYLGHQEILLEAQEGRYNILRSDGSIAKKLSEGERSAISFCYFLTQLRAKESKDIEDLVVVIDDPVSSLDAAAQTHAFSLMMEMTGKCSQVILLTHSTSFLSMTMRNWKKVYKKRNTKFLFLDCRISNASESRETSLTQMPGPLKDHHSEYHYLFWIVHEAAVNREREQLFFLPNVVRKLLEVFTSFHYPNYGTFSQALRSEMSHIGDDIDVVALERLVQIESHGTIESLEGLPSLTYQDASLSAKAAMKFIKFVSKIHYDRMVDTCNCKGKID